jgi:hypothetical protein
MNIPPPMTSTSISTSPTRISSTLLDMVATALRYDQVDGIVNSPISALRFIALSLRRT